MSASVSVDPHDESYVSAARERADQPVSETTERFMRAIIARVPLERIVEVHLFSPLRQGSVETGIAVVAANVAVRVSNTPEDGPALELGLGENVDSGDGADAVTAEESELHVKADAVTASATGKQGVAARHTVYTARYRLLIKGPDRGRWESELVEEADAPLVTVETVVRGVQRRSGGDSDIVRFTARQVARALRIEQES